MTCIVAYDITSNRRRARMAGYLKRSAGMRLQKSVFAIDVPGNKLKVLLDKLESLADMDTDTVAVFRLCASCQAKAVTLGETEPGFLVF